MRPAERGASLLLGGALAAALGGASVAAAPAKSSPSARAALVDQFDALRHEDIAVATAARRHERAIVKLQHDIALSKQDRSARERDLSESRKEQEELLGALERLARNPPAMFGIAPEGPIDRARTAALIKAAVPALSDEARALAAEIAKAGTLRQQIARDQVQLASEQTALAGNHSLLSQLTRRRLDLVAKLSPPDPVSQARLHTIAARAADLGQLIKDSDAETARRDHALARLAASSHKGAAVDPTRPQDLRQFDAAQAHLVAPSVGDIVGHFGDAGERGSPSQDLRFAAPAGSTILAPFDGRVVFAGPFRDDGLVLIIHHSGGYHSILAGLGRIDAKLGEWVLAGEPVGVMPEGATTTPGVALRYELWRGSQPIDPEPLLTALGGGRGNKAG